MSNVKIVNFIRKWRKHPGAVDMFTNGKCYWFAHILREAFPGGIICYDPIVGHFYYKRNEYYWDINGAHRVPTGQVHAWTDICANDCAWAKRIKRDCILFEEVE